MALRAISLFAGAGGLDLGLRRLGIRTVCFVEREAYATSVLVARMEDASMDPAPIWDDVTTFDGKSWRGSVDIVAGGFPCQDISNAGKRAGLDGERSGLWREYARIIDEVRPGIALIENVAALVGRGLDRVLADLHALGFDAEWGVFSASEVGAPHRRQRLFVLAHTERGYGWIQSRRFGGSDRPEAVQLERHREALAAADIKRKCEPDDATETVGVEGSRANAGGGCSTLAYADGWRCDREWVSGIRTTGSDGRSPSSCARYNADGCNVSFPPTRDDTDGWRGYLDAFPSLEPAIRRGADGLAHRVDRLRILGNGVVPAQAEYAFRTLASRRRREI